jgi:hypothetical protein
MEIFREPTRYPKRVTISPGPSERGTCKACQARQGTYEIDYGDTIEKALGSDGLPPFHPNCTCRAEIYFYDAGVNSLPKEEWERAKKELDRFYLLYKKDRWWGVFASYMKSRGLIQEKLRKKYPSSELLQDENLYDVLNSYLKGCAERASHLKNYFDFYIERNQIRGVWVEEKDLWLAHGWIVVHYQYREENGGIKQGKVTYDPWFIPESASKLLIKAGF